MKNSKIKKIILVVLPIILFLTISFLVAILCLMAPVSKNFEEKNITIPAGSSYYDIADILKGNQIIKNEKVFVYYLKVRRIDNIYAAAYYLSPDMNLKEVVDTLLEGGHNESEITLTFREGINMRKIVSIIEDETNNTKEDVYALLKDKDYLNELMEKYWFIDEEILNDEVYYSLEGYLFPDTYRISSADAEVSEIFEVMLNEMSKILENYKEDLENSNYSIHEILTLASLIELEGLSDNSRKGISGVFYNRLNNQMSLGADATTYYAFKIDMSERNLYQKELDTYNPYNTRGPKMAGKLPVGPICIAGQTSIEAALYPEDNDYLYFVTDKNGEVYFTKNFSEHERIINKLQEEGLWYEW